MPPTEDQKPQTTPVRSPDEPLEPQATPARSPEVPLEVRTTFSPEITISPRTPEQLARAEEEAASETRLHQRAWSHAVEVLSRIGGASAGQSIISLWLLESHSKKEYRLGADRLPTETSQQDLVNDLTRRAQQSDRIPVCLIHLRSIKTLPTQRGTQAPAEHARLRPVATPANNWTYEFGKLAELLDYSQSRPFRILVEAEAPYLRYVGLRTGASDSSNRSLAELTTLRLDKVGHQFVRFVDQGEVDCFRILTSFPREWDRQPMTGALDRSNIQAAAKQLLDAAERLELSGPTHTHQTDLDRFETAWEVARTEVKVRLEAVIEKLSKQPLSTYEEKRDLAAVLAKVMDRWGFRALSPTTGNPASLSVRKSSPKSLGKFQFDEKPDPASDAPVSQRSPKSGKAQLPAFKLVDKPLDGRRRVSN